MRKHNSFTLNRALKQFRTYFIERNDLLLGIVLVSAAVLTLDVLAARIDHAVEKFLDGESIKPGHWWLIAVSAVLVLFLNALIWWCQNVFRSLHVRYRINSSGNPKPYLVIFVSRQRLIKDLSEIPVSGPITIRGATLKREDLMEDAKLIDETQNPQWPWEMILRGIAPHLKHLRRIYLVGSAESQGRNGLEQGTFAQLDMLKRFLAPYLATEKAAEPSGVANMIVPWKQAVDFESFDDVHDTLESIRNTLIEELAEEGELCVDITGGQKPTSAAAGLFTVNKDVVIQYVQTNRPKDAQMHDVRLLEWPKKPE